MLRHLNVKRLALFIISCYIVVFVCIQIHLTVYSDQVNRPGGASARHVASTGDNVNNGDNVDTGENVEEAPDFSYGIANFTAGFAVPFSGVLLYSAFLDKRQPTPKIRMVAIVDTWNAPSGWCHFWPSNHDSAKTNSPYRQSRKDSFAFFHQEGNSNFTTQMQFYETCEGHRKRFIAYIITCVVPKDVGDKVLRIVVSKNPTWSKNDPKPSAEYSTQDGFEIPVVTMNNKPSKTFRVMDEYNNLSNKPKRWKFAVCIPPLFGSIPVDSMIEFIELSRILGADHFFFYSYGMQATLGKLLEMYTKSSTVTVLPWKHTLTSEDMWYYGQSAAIADCLYRTMGHFDWVAFNDIDEFMIPRDNFTESGTWDEFLTVHEKWNRTRFNNLASLSFQSAVFHISGSKSTNISNGDFLTMKTIERTESISSILTKQLVRPERVFELGIHHLSKPKRGNYRSLIVKSEAGLLHHYRKCQEGYQIVCAFTTPDKSIRRYNKALQIRAEGISKAFSDSQ